MVDMNNNRTVYVNVDVIGDGEDEYIEVIVPQDGVVYDIMLLARCKPILALKMAIT